MESISLLTPRQVQYLYHRERDKRTGAPKPLPYYYSRDKDNKVNEKLMFINMGLAMGITIEELEKQWREQHGGS